MGEVFSKGKATSPKGKTFHSLTTGFWVGVGGRERGKKRLGLSPGRGGERISDSGKRTILITKTEINRKCETHEQKPRRSGLMTKLGRPEGEGQN